MSNAFSCWTQAAVRRSPHGASLSPPGDLFEAPVDVEAPRPVLEPKPAKPASKPPRPATWGDGLRQAVRSALCGVAVAATYAGLVLAGYRYQVAHARPPPFALDDIEQARNWACLLGGFTPCAGAAGAALGACWQRRAATETPPSGLAFSPDFARWAMRMWLVPAGRRLLPRLGFGGLPGAQMVREPIVVRHRPPAPTSDRLHT